MIATAAPQVAPARETTAIDPGVSALLDEVVSRTVSRAVAAAAPPPPDFDALLRLGESLVPTRMLPEHINSPGAFAAIVLAGHELGLPMMRALRSLQMVKGKVTEAADSMLARFKSDGGRSRWIVLNEVRGELWLRHPNGDEHIEVFTVEMAEAAGLTRPGRNGEPSMYHKFPVAMMRSRAITAGLKSLGWEGGVGAYDPDELSDLSTPAAAVQSASRGAGAAAAQRPQAAPARQETPEEAQARVRAMTLEQAMDIPLYGKPESWGKKGGQPLSTISVKLLQRAEAFFADRYKEKLEQTGEHDERLYEQLVAIALVLPWRQQQEAAQPAPEPPAHSAPVETTPAPARRSDDDLPF